MKKRQMMFIPQINAHSFVFFYEMGSSGTSWSIRDYSIPHWVKRFGPSDFPWNAEDIHRMAEQAFDAPTHSTDDLEFWHRHTETCNQRLSATGQARAVTVPVKITADPQPPPISVVVQGDQPVLNLGELKGTSKGRKAQDMERILHSPNSEDWVTWNFFQILCGQYPRDWFGHIVAAARRRKPDMFFSFDNGSLPKLRLWMSVCAPRQFEQCSRARMLSSGNPSWIARAQNPDPVEGASEIDIAFDHDQYLIYVEAKLGSDISLCTSYDPERNQIARNIDCLIEQAGRRTPLFWMIVRDEYPSRAYVQLINSYRSNPSLLGRALPHRDLRVLETVAQSLVILRWADFEELVCSSGADQTVNIVRQELKRRITSPVAV